jgi:hypothetical protein
MPHLVGGWVGGSLVKRKPPKTQEKHRAEQSVNGSIFIPTSPSGRRTFLLLLLFIFFVVGLLFFFCFPLRSVKRTSSRPAVRSYKCRTCQTNRKCASRVLRTVHRRGFSIMRIVFGCCVYCAAVNTVVALGNSSCCWRD